MTTDKRADKERDRTRAAEASVLIWRGEQAQVGRCRGKERKVEKRGMRGKRETRKHSPAEAERVEMQQE